MTLHEKRKGGGALSLKVQTIREVLDPDRAITISVKFRGKDLDMLTELSQRLQVSRSDAVRRSVLTKYNIEIMREVVV